MTTDTTMTFRHQKIIAILMGKWRAGSIVATFSCTDAGPVSEAMDQLVEMEVVVCTKIKHVEHMKCWWVRMGNDDVERMDDYVRYLGL